MLGPASRKEPMLPSYLEDTDLSSIKLVATDMDLTLLADDKSMPEGIDERIDALTEHGIVFCAASGLRRLIRGPRHRIEQDLDVLPGLGQQEESR